MAETRENTEQPHTDEMIYLDGKMLEGGGQLVRNAVALSALTGKPITITDIRGKRQGKTGLKGSHTAAINFICEICQGEVIGAEVGSKTLTFYPRGRPHNGEKGKPNREPHQSSKTPLLDLTLANGELPEIKPEYTVHQSTVGSIFLIFQAVYPYLVYASSLAGSPVRLNVTGGTNVSCAPSFEYIDQVLVPNLRRFGLPELSIKLNGRGWSTGPRELGAVTFLIHPLQASDADVLRPGVDGSVPSGFPALNLSQYRRGTIAKVDITVLAPDIEFGDQQAQGNRKDRRRAHREGTQPGYNDMYNPHLTIREYLEEKIQKCLRRALRQMAKTQSSASDVENEADYDGGEAIPVNLRISETTHHNTHLYILLVAHTSTGLTLGADALFNGFKSENESRRGGKKRGEKGGNSMMLTLDHLVDSCVHDFIQEINGYPDGVRSESNKNRHEPCVDVHMRDQLVIFDALGSLELQRKKAADLALVNEEDERHWSLHTRTARWVCEKILGEDIWGGN